MIVPADDLSNWGRQPNHMTPTDAAKHLVQILTPSERMSVLRWCREIAAADGRQSAAETELLRGVARLLSGE
ncbi:MAG: TerB family tellurite resistance protein [Planctomycetes bacterium]|nr:TerB family tellurite resistance protein [Planctomycetota bacterium]